MSWNPRALFRVPHGAAPPPYSLRLSLHGPHPSIHRPVRPTPSVTETAKRELSGRYDLRRTRVLCGGFHGNAAAAAGAAGGGRPFVGHVEKKTKGKKKKKKRKSGKIEF